MSRYFLGIDVSTTGAKALLIDEKGEVAASATTALTLQTPKPLWSEQDPHEWWKGTAASIRKALAEAGAKGEDVAAVGLTGQMHGLVLLDAERRGPPPRHPVERPAHRRRVRRDREARREERSSSARSATSPSPASPPRRSSGSATTSPRSTRRRSSSCCRRTTSACASPARRRWTRPTAPARSCSTSRRAPGRSSPSRSWTSRPSGCRPTFEGPEVDRHGHRRGGGRDRPEGRHAGDGRRRRPGGGRRGRGRGAARRRLADPRHLRRRLRDDRRPARRARGAAARLLPRRARPLALHGRDALGRRQPAVVPRHPRPRRRASPTSWPRRSRPRRAARGCCSCPTSPASGRPTPTRSRAAASSA